MYLDVASSAAGLLYMDDGETIDAEKLGLFSLVLKSDLIAFIALKN